MKKRFLTYLILVLCLISSKANASHIVGGEMYYNHVSGNDYRVFVIIYRDCFSNGAPFDPTITVAAYDANGTLRRTVDMSFPGSTLLPITFTNPCIVPPTNICTEKAVYTGLMELPPIAGGYTLAFQRCCRGPAISNLATPEDFGITLQIKVPTSTGIPGVNSSPRFKNFPPLVICNNDFLEFDHSAIDPDGDQLIYSLATPFHGGSPDVPKPETPDAPPYSTVIWAPGHNQGLPLGPGSNLNIDPTTGKLTGQPNLSGLYVVGIQVEERRNGITVSKSIRDFVFNIIQCQITLNANIPQTQEEYIGTCEGLSLTFPNNSFGGTYYKWDFGVASVTTDTSNAYNPTFTFPSAGTYTVRLIAKKNNDCTDSTKVTLKVGLPVDLNFDASDSVCVVGNSIDFIGQAINEDGGTFSWDFGNNASPSVANSKNVIGVEFNQAGSFPVKFSYIHPECATDTTIQVLILDSPVVDFDFPLNYECDGLTINFIDQSENSVYFRWDFGDNTISSDTSNAQSPSYVYARPGTYTIQLIAGSTGACIDTTSKTIEVYDDLKLAIQSVDSICVLNNSIDFIGNVSGPSIASYSWNFGPNASPNTSNDTNVMDVRFSTSGNQTITLKGSYLQCEDSVTKNVFLFREPSIDFTLMPGKQCVAYTAQFIDQSQADSPIYYSWDFGNGGTSTLANPTNLYVDTGAFTVTLMIETREGCIAKLSKTRSDLIHVRPLPIARFDVNRQLLDVCDNEVILTDLSEFGGISTYNVGELNIIASAVSNPFAYNFLTSGLKNIELTSSNIYGCASTAMKSVYVEPFTVYFPNAFTPNSDEFNGGFGGETVLNTDSFHLRIYDRWGELVWESFDKNSRWDGTFGGKEVQQGIYHYIADIVTCGFEDKYRSIKGTVLLIR